MIYHSITDYLLAKNEYEQTWTKVTPDGKIFSFIDGNWIEGCDFDKPTYEPLPRVNMDGTAIISGIKPQHKIK